MTTLVSYNPSSGEPIGDVPVTAASEVPTVVQRARAAQPAWAALGAEGRGRLLAAAAARFEERGEELGKLITREMGKPLKEAVREARGCAAGLAEHLQEIAAAVATQVVEDKRIRSEVHHDPHGVCAAITPWNFPLMMPHWLVLPALATGNTVVLKPSEETPLCGQAYADVLAEGLPEDVLQVVHGADETGRTLVAAEVDLIAFTGSRETGKKILAAAADRLTRVILELGGKDPLLVLEDAHLEAAARFAATNSFRNAGQVCVSTERIFVPERIAARFVDLLAQAAGEMTVGDGFESDTRVGPMINGRQRDHVLRQIDAAVAAGAVVAAGGKGHHGNFIVPTVLSGVTGQMAIAREETFGPVACVTIVPDEEAAVQQANDTPFGLGAVVFGADDERAYAVARKLTAGMVGVNRPCGGAEGTPWVGARQSGYGFHRSPDGHRQFTQTRVVSRPRSDR